jgi:hypothetical protein
MVAELLAERPYFRLLTKQLEDLVRQSWNSAGMLQSIAKELLYRERKVAVRLRKRVINRLTEILEEQGIFLWPRTDPLPGLREIDQGVFVHQESPLKGMGYAVGMNGPTDKDRQAILDLAYQEKIPPVNSADYMLSWGKPQTSPRLKRMANLIATSVRNRKRRKDTATSLAIEEWERDLAYLKQAYYDGRYDVGREAFLWPETDVPL